MVRLCCRTSACLNFFFRFSPLLLQALRRAVLEPHRVGGRQAIRGRNYILHFCAVPLSAFPFSTAFPFSLSASETLDTLPRFPWLARSPQVVFLQPVDVGDLVHLDACVLYTKEG